MINTRRPESGDHGEPSRLTPAEIDAIGELVAARVAALLEAGPRRDGGPPDEDGSLAVSYKAAGKMLGITDRMIWTLCKQGRLKAISIGRARRVLRSSIDDFLNTNSKSA